MVSARFRITLIESQRVMVLASPKENVGVLLSRDLYMIQLKLSGDGILQNSQFSSAVDMVLPSSEGWRGAPGWVPCLRRWTIPTGWYIRTETRHRAVTVGQECQESPGRPLGVESPSTAIGLEGELHRYITQPLKGSRVMSKAVTTLTAPSLTHAW